MKPPKRVPLPRAPVSPFVQRAAARWKPGDFAYHAPTAGVELERPHEHVPTGKGARNAREHE